MKPSETTSTSRSPILKLFATLCSCSGLGRLPRHVAAEVRRVSSRGVDGVLLAGAADGGAFAVAGQDYGVVGEGVQPLPDGGDGLLELIGAVGVAGTSGKQGVAADQVPPDQETAAPRRVSRRVDHRQAQRARGQAGAVCQGV